MSYEEFKSLCREAWKEKYNYLEINKLEDKNGKKYCICNESKNIKSLQSRSFLIRNTYPF